VPATRTCALPVTNTRVSTGTPPGVANGMAICFAVAAGSSRAVSGSRANVWPGSAQTSRRAITPGPVPPNCVMMKFAV
jgi:hypothetical protein